MNILGIVGRLGSHPAVQQHAHSALRGFGLLLDGLDRHGRRRPRPEPPRRPQPEPPRKPRPEPEPPRRPRK